MITMWILNLIQVALMATLGSSLCAEWDHIVYTRQWGQATCLQDLRAKKHKCCFIPANVTDWTIHGIWPSNGTSKGPESCPQCSGSFDPKKLQPIEDDLKQVWPTFFPAGNDSMNSFWAHEWNKHGRCGVDVQPLKDELGYFKTGLELNKRYNLDQALRRSGITPSDEALYPIPMFLKVLTHVMNAEPIIECFHDTKLNKQYVVQVEVCLSRDLKPIACPESAPDRANGCKMDMDLSYPILESGGQFPPDCLKQDITLRFLSGQ